MDGIAQVGIIPYQEWVRENQDTIDMLVWKYGRKGVTINEDEAWKYLAWALSQHDLVMRQVGGGRYADHADYIKSQVADACVQHFTMKQTGDLGPPVGPRFDKPTDFTKLNAVGLSNDDDDDAPDVYKGYL